MSLLELEDKIEKFLSQRYDDSHYFYNDVIIYINDNETIFLDLYDTVSIRTKIIINNVLNTGYKQTLLDCFLASDETWTFFLRFTFGQYIYFDNKELLIESYRQEKLDGVNDIGTYQNLLGIFFATNDSFDQLPDAFIDQYQNINDVDYAFFWILLFYKDIKLLKRYANKYQFKITENNRYTDDIYKNWLPIDVIKESVIPHTDGCNMNNDKPYGDIIPTQIVGPGGDFSESEMYYQSVKITNENILEIVWQLMNDDKYYQIMTIVNYFDHMTMSECVCWYARITSKHTDEDLFRFVCQTSSYVFLEYAIDFVNTYDVKSWLTDKIPFRLNFNEPFIKTIIKLKPEMLDLLICYALRCRDTILNILIPNITCQDVIKYLEEHPELLENQALNI